MIERSTGPTESASDLPFKSSDADITTSYVHRNDNSVVSNIAIVVSVRLFRDGIERALQSQSRKISGTYEMLGQIISAVDPASSPDLFVVSLGESDLCFRELSLICEIRPRLPKAKWIILSKRRDEIFMREALAAGIEGLLFEDSPSEVLQLVVDLVLQGYYCVPMAFSPSSDPSYLSPEYKQTLMGPFSRATQKKVPVAFSQSIEASGRNLGLGSADRFSPSSIDTQLERGTQAQDLPTDRPLRLPMPLSDREKEIVHCLVGGQSNKLIARQLQISEATVKVHVKALLRKMNVANRTQAAVFALNLMKQGGNIERAPGVPHVVLNERQGLDTALAAN